MRTVTLRQLQEMDHISRFETLHCIRIGITRLVEDKEQKNEGDKV